jgi:hypothetical protein
MTKTVSYLLAAATLAAGVAGSIAATSAQAQSWGSNRGPSLTMFSEEHFRGDQRTITSDLNDFRRIDFENVADSLVAVGTWEVCHGFDYRTDCRLVEGEVPVLGRWGNGLSSARYVGPGSGGGNPGFPGNPGWGQYQGQSVRGDGTTFFPGRITDPRCSPRDRRCSAPADQRSADSFCRAQGLSQAVFFGSSRRGGLTDVLCR